MKDKTELKQDPRNLNKHNQFGMALLEKSMRKFGFVEAGVISEDNVICGGNARNEVAEDIGITEKQIIEIDGTKQVYLKVKGLKSGTKEFAELGLILNAVPKANIEWDLPAMELVCAEFDIAPMDWGIDIPKEATEDDYEIPDEIKTDIVRGDIFELTSGNLRHRIGCLDATSETDVKLLMGNEKADMVFTDPPYGMFYDPNAFNKKTRVKKYDKVIGDNEDFTPELINTIFQNFGYCKEIIIFGANYFTRLIPNVDNGGWFVWDKRIESQDNVFGSGFELIWSKEKHQNKILRFDWLEKQSSVNPEEAKNRLHTTQKPSKLIGEILNKYSKENNLIVDLYLGSGTSLIACEQLNRNCFGSEISPQYCEIIIQRYCTYMKKENKEFTITLNSNPYTPK